MGDEKRRKELRTRKVNPRLNIAMDPEEMFVDCPRSGDVVFRRGKYCAYSHPGNIYYQSLIEEFYEDFSSTTSRKEKTRITWDIVDTICKSTDETEREYDRRFLEWDTEKSVWAIIIDPKRRR